MDNIFASRDFTPVHAYLDGIAAADPNLTLWCENIAQNYNVNVETANQG